MTSGTNVTTGGQDGEGLSEAYLAEQFVQFCKEGQCLMEDMTLDFIWHRLDIIIHNEKWISLPESDKINRVRKMLETLETEGKVISKMMVVKKRQFLDDINPPRLSKKVRTYIIKRSS